MLPNLVFAGLLLQSAAAAPAQATPPAADEWIVVVAAPVYQPDGAVTAETVTLPAAGAGLVHVFGRRSMCDLAVGGAGEPSDAGFGWRVASQIVSRSEKDIVVSLDWRRLWDNGRRIQNGPGGTVQLTLHPGDRIPLDHLPNSTPRGDCRAVGLGLEIRLGRAKPAPPAPPSTLPLGATAGGAKPVDAELWLIHTLPSGAEQVTHQVVRVPASGGRFGFAASTVTTTRGDVKVEMAGSIDRYRTPTGAEFMLLNLTRTVSGEGLPAAGLAGTTGSVMPLPLATEVLAFEMPGGRSGGGGAGGRGGGGGGGGSVAAGARQGGGGARSGGLVSGPPTLVASLLAGHQFALRVRIVPVN